MIQEQPPQQETQKGWFANFRKYFIRGLIVVLPLWISLFILWLIFKWISNVTRPFLAPIFELFFEKEPASFLLTITSFLVTIFAIYIAGILATNIASRKILSKIEAILIKIPFLRGIYTSAREFVQFIFSKQIKYHRVVLVEWPRKGIFTIGFVTSEPSSNSEKEKFLSIFVPSTPNPTTGYFFLIPEKETIPLEISIEEALKMIISGGVVISPHSKELIIKKMKLTN
ncbi:MAG: DUF502 domain-containing protein [Endomicrobiia bacterium]